MASLKWFGWVSVTTTVQVVLNVWPFYCNDAEQMVVTTCLQSSSLHSINMIAIWVLRHLLVLTTGCNTLQLCNQHLQTSLPASPEPQWGKVASCWSMFPSLTHPPQTLRTHPAPAKHTPSLMITLPSISMDPPYPLLQPLAPLLSFASITPPLHPHWPMPCLPCTLVDREHPPQLWLCLSHTLPRPCLPHSLVSLFAFFTSSPQLLPHLPRVPSLAAPPSHSYSPFPSLTFLVHPP